ncbi:MAG TPA: DUF2252 family protein [Vicinamibacterales bacterium]|jgi:hypothetical protein
MRASFDSCHPVRFALVVALGVAADGPAQTTTGAAPLRPEASAVGRASPELVERLVADELTYFRFVNRPWTARVCEMFASVLQDVPVVQLHGDAHVEQYAVTSQAWGLDDFDDSARGPSLVDIVRFLGSIDVVARRRGWSRDTHAFFDRFFEGYRHGLKAPGSPPPEPEFVRRLRAAPARDRAAHLAWGEQMMEPLSDEARANAAAGLELFSRLVHKERPDLPPGYFTIRRLGRLGVGIGSATINKILARVEGPSSDPGDDVLLEAKEPSNLDGLGCLQLPSSTEAVRVIAGSNQLGRIRHDILGVVPEYEPKWGVRKWWMRSWEPSYREVRVNDLGSVRDLSALVYDSAFQLGAGRVQGAPAEQAASLREAELAAVGRLEGRLRRAVTELIAEMMAGWREFRDSIRAQRR